MDTIIFLKSRNRNQKDREETNAFCRIRSLRSGYGILEGDQLLLVEVPHQTALTVEWIRELECYLRPFWGYSASIETLTDRSLEDGLRRQKQLQIWRESWSYPVYSGLHRREYAGYLLEQALKHRKRAGNEQALPRMGQQLRIYVLGYAFWIPALLNEWIPCMEQLQLVMTPEQYKQAQQLEPEALRPEAYLDALSAEEGIAAACRVTEPQRPEKGRFAGFRLNWTVPALVIDLSGAPGVLAEPGQGTLIWIDMDASEEKRRRLQLLCPQISYFSMKEVWRRLDTERKNGYNTLVN